MFKRNKGWLVSDFDHYEPEDDYHDVMTGKYLNALSELPDSIRQLLEDGDLHVELAEINNRYRVTKIVKKREPEFEQGKDKFFIVSKEGDRIPCSEEEYNSLFFEQNKEDLYSGDIELESLESFYSPPMDSWDIVFDETNYIQEAKAFVQAWNEEYADKKEVGNPYEYLNKLYETEVYSSDWFPYSVSKQFHHSKAKELAQKILNREISTKRQLGEALGPRNDTSRSIIYQVGKMRKDAKELPQGKEKAALLAKASKIMLDLGTNRRNYKGKITSLIGESDRRKLWSLLETTQLEDREVVKMVPWKFEKIISVRLQKQIMNNEISEEEANKRLKVIVNRIYPDYQVKEVGRDYINYMNKVTQKLNKLPEWIVKEKRQEDLCEFQPIEWMPSEIELDNEQLEQDFN